MLSFYIDTIFVQIVIAGAAVTPTSILHLPFLLQPFVSSALPQCLIKVPLRETYPHVLQQGSLALLSLLVISTQRSCLSQRDERLEGARLHAHLDWISSCRLSVISLMLGKSSGFAAQVSSDALIRQIGSHTIDPATDGFLLDKRQMKPPSFPISAPDNSKAISTCCPLLAPTSNI